MPNVTPSTTQTTDGVPTLSSRSSESSSAQGLRVLILLHDAVSGGHVVQANGTAAALRRFGAEVDVLTSVPDGRRYDVIHAFDRRHKALRSARQSSSIVALSPIWWKYGRESGRMRSKVDRAERAVRVAISAARRGIDETATRLRTELEEVKIAFELPDLLLPNSQGEARAIRDDLAVSTRISVVPNGFDPEIFHMPLAESERSGVLCVARLEPHKNQLGLIRELSGTGTRLTLVGDEHPHHSGYAARCRSAASDSVQFLPAQSQTALATLYHDAAVHVLPSWFETTGLVSLEAAASGCAVVSTCLGYANEYFGEHAQYCDPGKRGSIRRAVLDALNGHESGALRRHVETEFSWDETARRTLSAYLAAL